MHKYAQILGRVVRLHRQVLGIDLPTMGEAVGMSASGWSRVETGVTTMTVLQLRYAAKKLRVKPWTIVKQADLILEES